MSFFVEPRAWFEGGETAHAGSKRETGEYIPAGSLHHFPEVVQKIHVEEDVRYLGRQSWVSELSVPCNITLLPQLSEQSYGYSLPDKVAALSPRHSILTPYEIAYLAALWCWGGRGRLFRGRVRTEMEVFGHPSHLMVDAPTVTVSYDSEGKLRFEREYPMCQRKDLGVLIGIRR